MANINVNDTVEVVAVEYAGVGTIPHFVIKLDGEYKYIPIKTGINRIDQLTEEEE
jgi:hypothetical protein|tara:strand:+ start:289 stop:453 length:165 start_codon:yes stop_codon:yes gene_type:complete